MKASNWIFDEETKSFIGHEPERAVRSTVNRVRGKGLILSFILFACAD